jgi:hypothetical protein
MSKNLQQKICDEVCTLDDRFATGDEYPTKMQERQANARVFAKELGRMASEFNEVLEVLETVAQEIKITLEYE